MKINVKAKLRILHKYIGFTFSLFIFHLTLTGVLLLYPNFFKISDTYISNNFILKKYNMLTFEDVRQFSDTYNEVIVLQNNIYFNKNLIDSIDERVVSVFYEKKK